MKKEKHWFKFYPYKWMGDIELRTCTPMARALLIDLMSISFPTGIFDLKTREEKKQFIRQIGFTPIKFERSLNELLNKRRIVFDKNLDKFYIPKMRKDHEDYEIAQQNGKKGGNPKLVGVILPLNPPLNPEVEVEVEKEEEAVLKKTIFCVMTEIYRSLTPPQVDHIKPFIDIFQDVEKFDGLAKRIYAESKYPPNPAPLKLCQMVEAELKKPSSETPKRKYFNYQGEEISR